MSSDDPIIVRTLKGHKDAITSVAFHPCPSDLLRRKQPSNTDLQQIASSSQDGGLILWNYQSDDSEVRAFKFIGHTDSINHICYSPTGRLLASCSSDKTVRLWIPKRSGESVVLKGHNAAVRCVDFGHQDSSSQDSLLVTCSDDKTLKLWNLPSKAFRKSLVGHKNWVRSCQFSPDSKFVISGSDDGTMKLWDINSGDNVVTYKFPSSINTSQSSMFESIVGVRHTQFHPCGSLFAASGSNGNVHMYDLRSDKIVHSFPEMNSSSSLSMGLAFHSGGNQLMTSSSEGAFSMWDLRNYSCSWSICHTKNKAFEDCKTKTYSCGFSSSGANFVTGGMDKRVLVWKQNLDHNHECGKNEGRGSKKYVRKESNIVPNREYMIEDMVTDNTEVTPKKNKMNSKKCSQQISEPLADILGNLIQQMELVTNSMTIIEKRVSIIENSMMRKKKPSSGKG